MQQYSHKIHPPGSTEKVSTLRTSTTKQVALTKLQSKGPTPQSGLLNFDRFCQGFVFSEVKERKNTNVDAQATIVEAERPPKNEKKFELNKVQTLQLNTGANNLDSTFNPRQLRFSLPQTQKVKSMEQFRPKRPSKGGKSDEPTILLKAQKKTIINRKDQWLRANAQLFYGLPSQKMYSKSPNRDFYSNLQTYPTTLLNSSTKQYPVAETTKILKINHDEDLDYEKNRVYGSMELEVRDQGTCFQSVDEPPYSYQNEQPKHEGTSSPGDEILDPKQHANKNTITQKAKKNLQSTDFSQKTIKDTTERADSSQQHRSQKYEGLRVGQGMSDLDGSLAKGQDGVTGFDDQHGLLEKSCGANSSTVQRSKEETGDRPHYSVISHEQRNLNDRELNSSSQFTINQNGGHDRRSRQRTIAYVCRKEDQNGQLAFEGIREKTSRAGESKEAAEKPPANNFSFVSHLKPKSQNQRTRAFVRAQSKLKREGSGEQAFGPIGKGTFIPLRDRTKRAGGAQESKKGSKAVNAFESRRNSDDVGTKCQSQLQLQPTVINFRGKKRTQRTPSGQRYQEAQTSTENAQQPVELQVLPIDKEQHNTVPDHFEQTQLMAQTQYLTSMDPIYPQGARAQEQRGRNRRCGPHANAKGTASSGFYAITNKELITPGIESDLSSTRNLGVASVSETAEQRQANGTGSGNAPNRSSGQGTEMANRGAFRPQKIQRSKKAIHERSYSLGLVSRFIRPAKQKERPANEDLDVKRTLQPWPFAEQEGSGKDYIQVGGIINQDGKMLVERTMETASVNESQEYSGQAVRYSQQRLLPTDMKGNTASRYTVKFQNNRDPSDGSPLDYNTVDCYKMGGHAQALHSGRTRTAEFRPGRVDTRMANEESYDDGRNYTNVYTSVERTESKPGRANLSDGGDGDHVDDFTGGEKIPRIASKEGHTRQLGLSPYGVQTEHRGSRSGFVSDRQISHESVIRCIEQDGKMYQEELCDHDDFFNRGKNSYGTSIRGDGGGPDKRPRQPMTLRQKGHQAIQSELVKRAMKLKNRKQVNMKPVNLGVMENLTERENALEEPVEAGKQHSPEVVVEASVPEVTRDRKVQRKTTGLPSTVENEKSKRLSMNGQLSRSHISDFRSNNYVQREEQEQADSFNFGKKKSYGKESRHRDFQQQRRSDDSRVQQNNLLARTSHSESNNHKLKGHPSRTKSFADAHPQNLMKGLDHSNNDSEGGLMPQNFEDEPQKDQNALTFQRRPIHLDSNEYNVNAQDIMLSGDAIHSGATTGGVNSKQMLGNAQSSLEPTRAFSAAGIYQKRPHMQKLMEFGARRSVSPGHYNADVRAVTAGIKNRAIRKKPRDLAKAKDQSSRRHSLCRSSTQQKSKMQQPISIVTLELQAPGNYKSVDQQGFPLLRMAKKRASHALQANSTQKQREIASREYSRSQYCRGRRPSQTNDGETHVETQSVGSSRARRKDALNDSKEAGTSPLESFGRLYEQKRMAQIQNICIDDVVEEVKLIESAFEQCREDVEASPINTSQTNSKLDCEQLQSLLAVHGNANLSRQYANQNPRTASLPNNEPTSQTQSPPLKTPSSRSKTDMTFYQVRFRAGVKGKNEENTGVSTLMNTAKQSRDLTSKRGTSEVQPQALIQKKAPQEDDVLVAKKFDLSLAERSSTEAYQCSFVRREQVHKAHPARILINNEERSMDFVESPDRGDARSGARRGKTSIGSSRDLRIHLSQEEQGHFDTITNPSQRHSSPKAKNRTPSQNSPEKFRQVQILEEDKLLITPSYAQDEETQINKQSLMSKEPFENTAEEHDELESRNQTIPLVQLGGSKGGDKSNTTAGLLTSFHNQQYNNPRINSSKIEIVNKDLAIGAGALKEDENAGAGNGKHAAIADRKKSLNSLLGEVGKPILALKATRSGSPYVPKNLLPAKEKNSERIAQAEQMIQADRKLSSSFFERRGKNQSSVLRNYESKLINQNQEAESFGPTPKCSFTDFNIGKKPNEKIPLRRLIRHQKNLTLPRTIETTIANQADSRQSSRDNSTLKDLTHESLEARNGPRALKIQQIFQNVVESDFLHEQRTFGQDHAQLKSSVTFGSDSNIVQRNDSQTASQMRAKLGMASSKSTFDRPKYMNIKGNYAIDHFSKEDLKKIVKNETVYVTIDPIAQAIQNGSKRKNFRSIQPVDGRNSFLEQRLLKNSYFQGYYIGLKKEQVLRF